VTAGLAVITGTEDRQHAYVALTRGTDANLAYVFTVSPKQADPVPGPRPAPELARYDTINAERAGRSAPATDPALPGTALGVLSAVLGNDGQQLSATQARYQALTDADHLAVLYAIWTAETTPARDQHYRDLLMNALPPGRRAEPGHQARWLWRTLRAAELAGLDPARVLAEAIAERDLAGSRDVGLDGTEYEIDLNAEHAQALRDALARYVSAARRAGSSARRPVRSGRKAPASGLNTIEVREWAKAQGIEVKDRGRVPAELVVKFKAATGNLGLQHPLAKAPTCAHMPM